jgi:hypothetical protein
VISLFCFLFYLLFHAVQLFLTEWIGLDWIGSDYLICFIGINN